MGNNMNEQLKPFMAGFSLCGKRQRNGKIRPHFYHDKNVLEIDEWPETIELFNNTYGLEEVVSGVDCYEWANYC
jgi:hypothetical protein